MVVGHTIHTKTRCVRDNNRLSELTTTGNILGNVARTSYALRSSWKRRLTETNSVSLEYSYTSSRYAENRTGLTNYEQQTLGVSYDHQLTELCSFGGNVTATFYRPDDPGSSDTYQAVLGVSCEISETLGGGFFIGPLHIESEGDMTSTASPGTATDSSYGVRLRKEFARSILNVELERGPVPSSAGELLLQDRLSVEFAFPMSASVSVGIPASLYRNKAVDSGNASQEGDRIFFQSEPALIWRVTENIALRVAYRYRSQRYKDSGEVADSNAVFLSLSYMSQTK